MKFSRTKLDGLWLIELELREDERGFLARTYCESRSSPRRDSTPAGRNAILRSPKVRHDSRDALPNRPKARNQTYPAARLVRSSTCWWMSAATRQHSVSGKVLNLRLIITARSTFPAVSRTASNVSRITAFLPDVRVLPRRSCARFALQRSESWNRPPIANPMPSERDPQSAITSRFEMKILVTGATGFIGSAFCKRRWATRSAE